MQAILLDHKSRRALAGYLELFERPKLIEPEIWRQLLHAEAIEISVADLKQLVDVISPAVLDVLMYRVTL